MLLHSTKTQHIQISGFTRQKQKGKTKAQTQDTLFHNIVRVTCVWFCMSCMTMKEREYQCMCVCEMWNVLMVGPFKYYMAHLLWRYKQNNKIRKWLLQRPKQQERAKTEKKRE